MTPRSAEEIAREAREIALDAVQSADRAFELCACKSEHRLIEALVSRIAAALVARAEAAERRVAELEEVLRGFEGIGFKPCKDPACYRATLTMMQQAHVALSTAKEAP